MGRLLHCVLLLVALVVFIDTASVRGKKVCVNGQLDGDKCFCHDSWTGASCHRPMHCEGFDRNDNGSCVKCLFGWSSADCDVIDCHGHGQINYDETSCDCDKPYSGDFCETFTTEAIYSYYNNFATKTGALGVLTVIPLFIIYMSCEKCARRRQQERVERHLTGTFAHPTKNVNSSAVAMLLAKQESSDSDNEAEKE